MGIISYIPFYYNNDKHLEELNLTISSLIDTGDFFKKIKIFYCQKDIKDKVLELIKSYSSIELIYIDEANPRYLPVDVFNYMKLDIETPDNAVLYYTESDQILNVDKDYFSQFVTPELKKNHIVMPHRLGRTKAVPTESYETYNEYYIGNNYLPGNRYYNGEFIENLDYIESKHHNAYSGCYFTEKKSIQKLVLNKVYGKLFFMERIYGFIHIHFKFIRKFFIKGHLPYGLILEAPSLVLIINGLKVLKPIDPGKLNIVHLSKDGYV